MDSTNKRLALHQYNVAKSKLYCSLFTFIEDNYIRRGQFFKDFRTEDDKIFLTFIDVNDVVHKDCVTIDTTNWSWVDNQN